MAPLFLGTVEHQIFALFLLFRFFKSKSKESVLIFFILVEKVRFTSSVRGLEVYMMAPTVCKAQ
jgi:hypothetical protein